MNERPRIGQRIQYGTGEEYFGTVIEPGPEQSLVEWNNGNRTYALNKWFTPLPDEPVRCKGPLARAMRVAEQKQRPLNEALNLAAQMDRAGRKMRAEQDRQERKPPPDDLPERLKAYDAAALKQFAINNGVWQDKYQDLPNPGLVRMNVVNRLRAKVKAGHEVVWK